MTEQAQGAPRTSIALDWNTRERLADLERQIAAKENRTMSANLTVAWLLDRVDAADLP